MSKSSTGLDENIASALTYVIGPVTGIVFLVLEKGSKTVRFNAMQSTVYFGLLWVLTVVANIFSRIPLIGIIGGFVSWAIGVLVVLSILYLAWQAYQGKTFKIPYIGDIAWNQVNR